MLATFFIYLLKSVICLLVFSLFFRLLLISDTFVRFSRMVLLSGLLLCLVLPLVTVEVEAPTAYQQPIQHLEKIITTATEETVIPELPKVSEVSSELQLPQEPQRKIWRHYMFWVLLVYGIGVLAMLGRLLYSFYKLWNIVRKGEITYFEGQKILLVEREISAFSFFNLIVLSHKDYKENPQEIITHEQMHSLYLHSVDALFVELLLVVQWFNVGLWSLRNDLRALHEYEADRGVLRTGIDATRYQLLLVKKAVGERCFTSVANSFNHSLIKNRITMMLKKETQWWQRLKVVLVVPMAVGMLYAFAQPAVVETMDNVQQDVIEVTKEPMYNQAMRVWKYVVEFDISKDKRIAGYERNEPHSLFLNKSNQIWFDKRKFPINFASDVFAKEVSDNFYKRWKKYKQIKNANPQIFTFHQGLCKNNHITTVIKITDALIQGYDDAITRISKETGKDYEDISRENPLLIVYNKYASWWLPPPPAPPVPPTPPSPATATTPPTPLRVKEKSKKDDKVKIEEIAKTKQENQCYFISSSDNGKIYLAANFPIEVLRELLKPERKSLGNVSSFNMYLGKLDTVKKETINEVKSLLRKNNRLKLRYEASSPKKNVFKVPSEKSDVWNTPKGFPIAQSAIKSTSKFGMRLHPILHLKKMHTGIDYAASKGTPIVATANGTVITVKSDKRKYGNHIIIKHNDTFKTLYAHLQEINVKQGQMVKKGQVIGTVGNTGMVTGTVLHYEVRKEGKPVNPANYL